MTIHKTAIIGKEVTIGANCEIGPYCVIEGNTTIGKDCKIFTGAVIGSSPQDLKYKGEETFLKIGDSNIIREYATINPGTDEGSSTIIGNNNLIMAYCHIAHNCIIGNSIIMANSAGLAGHVRIEDKAVLGGMVAVHQFVRVGTLAIIGGCSKVVQDVVPYSITDGHPARCYGVNKVGLKRAGIEGGVSRNLNRAFKILFRSGLSLPHALEKIEKEIKGCPEVSYLIDFVKKSKRGIA